MGDRGEDMELQRIKCSPLVHAWDLAVSPTYIVDCNGKKAVILDRQYNLLQTVEGLDYVYKAHLSQDEKQLLLISNVAWRRYFPVLYQKTGCGLNEVTPKS